MSIFSTVILNFTKFRLVCSTHFRSVETCGVNSLLWYLGPIRFILLTFKFDLMARNSSDFYNFSLDTRLLYRSCIALFYRKRLPQQQRDRWIGERETGTHWLHVGRRWVRAIPPHPPLTCDKRQGLGAL